MDSDSGVVRGQLMREYNALVSKIRPGLSEAAVQELLGQPAAVAAKSAAMTPTDYFRELGSQFRFEDESADLIWVYQDPNRPRVRNYVAFKDGEVCTTWRETVTPERWKELNR
jgi:hypothetical protein